ncbi:MAG: membrane protein insertase YidC [Candidatus Pacebacteria bacterium]|nr:membrane protein insertase YidC [Candidatus Paceibacterota bacterium]MBP9058261.1 membrane protein insertase YidC [Candidatus Paceibacterota bacterium]MBP9770500.1 membrane protein insertase YidC [Candidatus Paceibacterota bacterium]
MISLLWHEVFYQPIYNLLIFFAGVFPRPDIGVAVVIVTVIVRLVIYPLSKKAIYTQIAIKKIQPELNKIKETIKDRTEQSRKTLEVYKQNKVNPFSSFAVILVQLPIILALFKVFSHDLTVSSEILYGFISPIESLDPLFLGFFDLTQKSMVLALLAAASQAVHFFVMKIGQKEEKTNKEPSKEEFFRKTMERQMKFLAPIMIGFVSYAAGGVVALYFTVSSVFSALQEWYIRKNIKA